LVGVAKSCANWLAKAQAYSVEKIYFHSVGTGLH